MMHRFFAISHMTSFHESCSMYERYHQSETNTHIEKDKPEEEPKPEENPKPELPKPEEKPKAQKPKSLKKDDFQKKLREVAKLKAKYHTVCSKINCVVEAAANDPKWAFSDNKQLAGALKEGIADIKVRLTSSGTECLLVQEAKELKASLEED